jgi:hypothetical protein
MIFLITILLIEPRGLQGFYEKFKSRRSTTSAQKAKKEETKQ